MARLLIDSSRRNTIKSIAGCAAIACATALLGACSKAEAPQFKSIDLTGADYAKDFALPDQNGQVRSLKDFAGKVVVVFFGFTQCPDVCPASMAELAQIKQSLGADGDKLQAVFVTIDPERDTPEILKSYMASFDPAFVALRGTLEQTQATAKEFKVYFAKVPGKAIAA